MRRCLAIWGSMAGTAVATLAVVAGLVAASGAEQRAAELATGPAASGRSVSDTDAADAAAAALVVKDASLLPPAIVPTTTTTLRPAQTTTTVARIPGSAPTTTLQPTTTVPATTTTTNPCYENPRPARVTLVSEFSSHLSVALNGSMTMLGSGERRDVEVVPGHCWDEASVNSMMLPGMPCPAAPAGGAHVRIFEPGRQYVVTVVANPDGCYGLPLPMLQVRPVPTG